MRPPLLALLLVQLIGVCAVKEYLFKDCTQLGFCARNRHYAGHVSPSTSPYTIDLNAVSVEEYAITGHVTKTLPGGRVLLPFSLSVLDGENVRFLVDEDRSAVDLGGLSSSRHNGTAAAAFGDSPGQKAAKIEKSLVKRLDSAISYAFGAYSFTLTRNVALTVEKNGQVEVQINSRGLFNVEHFRREDENSAHVHAFELGYDMFRDSFPDNTKDTLPFGPESVAVDVAFPGFTHVYGLAEHADLLALKDTVQSAWPYRLYNVDIFEYETNLRMPMYGLIPLMTATKPGTSVGVFWVNSADTFVDIEHGERSVQSHWMSENGVLDLVVFLGDLPLEVGYKYGRLTGFAALPPEFALGYHQCRWNYNDEEDVLDITKKMDLHRIPYDTIWLDVEYADQKKFFTWNPSAFPDPSRMLRKLDETGRNLVVLIDPHFKTDYEISNFVLKSGISINDAANDTYKGHCWPGESVWIDALNPSAQEYWDLLFELNGFFSNQTNIHIWNDMNEPSFFNGPETTSPRDNLHYGALEHRSIHNLWGKSFHELTYHSLIKRLQDTPRKRPFILTRSYFSGSQRTAAMWTGDNMAQWEHLQQSIPMILTSNIVGMPFAGADVGGFFGDPEKELLARWYQTGIWYPFFRAHAHIDSRRREPWVAGEPYTSIMRDAVRLRYALLPVLYTAFYEASVQGAPVVKPMFYEYPSNTELYGIEDQFYVGNSGILVKPVTSAGAEKVSVYLPSETHYDYTNGVLGPQFSGRISKSVTLHDIPMFIKGGSAFARRDRYRRLSRLMRNDPFSLVFALDKKGKALGKLYIDDGDTFAYKDGDFMVSTFSADDGKLHGDCTGQHETQSRVERISVAGLDFVVGGVLVKQDGKAWRALFSQKDASVEVHNPNLVLSAAWDVEFERVHDEL